MSKIPADLKYTKDHEWAKQVEPGLWEVGITDFAQDQLGDITFVELPDAGTSLDAGESFGTVESVKTFSDLYAPVAGEVEAINEDVIEDPAALNEEPYAKWLMRIRVADDSVFDALMDAAAYETHVASVE